MLATLPSFSRKIPTSDVKDDPLLVEEKMGIGKIASEKPPDEQPTEGDSTAVDTIDHDEGGGGAGAGGKQLKQGGKGKGEIEGGGAQQGEPVGKQAATTSKPGATIQSRLIITKEEWEQDRERCLCSEYHNPTQLFLIEKKYTLCTYIHSAVVNSLLLTRELTMSSISCITSF